MAYKHPPPPPSTPLHPQLNNVGPYTCKQKNTSSDKPPFSLYWSYIVIIFDPLRCFEALKKQL